MGSKTRIEWADATWNPVTGCSHVSEGCEHCYAERMDRRFQTNHPGCEWLPWTAENATQNVVTHPERLDRPLRWRKPKRIFVCSMSDLFHESVQEDFRDLVFEVMLNCDRHVFMLLTKRPEEMRRHMSSIQTCYHADLADGRGHPGWTWPPENIWLGVTVENQRRADERVPVLLRTPAAKRFVSIEPMLGPVDLTHVHPDNITRKLDALSGYYNNSPYDEGIGNHLDWVIVGGETGPGARSMHVEDVRRVRDDCKEAGVPFFFKQWGEWFPGEGRVGKKRGGRLLDGREHNEVPE